VELIGAEALPGLELVLAVELAAGGSLAAAVALRSVALASVSVELLDVLAVPGLLVWLEAKLLEVLLLGAGFAELAYVESAFAVVGPRAAVPLLGVAVASLEEELAGAEAYVVSVAGAAVVVLVVVDTAAVSVEDLVV